MDNVLLYQPSNYHELIREKNGNITFRDIFENTEESSLFPTLRECSKHGNIPSIISNYEGEVLINLNCCQYRESTIGTKEKAILLWNSSPLVTIDEEASLHPVLALTLNDSSETIKSSVDIFSDKLDEISQTDRSRQEKKLINLLSYWNEFCLNVKKSSLPTEKKKNVVKSEPPLVLVKTWLFLVESNEVEDSVKRHAKRMLEIKIGPKDSIEKFKKKHSIG